MAQKKPKRGYIPIDGEKLANMRQDRMMTQASLAAASGLSIATVQRYEGYIGDTPLTMTPPNFLRLAEALGVRADVLRSMLAPNMAQERADILARSKEKMQALLRTTAPIADSIPSGVREVPFPVRRVPVASVKASGLAENVARIEQNERGYQIGDDFAPSNEVPADGPNVVTCRIDGDCMTPPYINGQLAVFSYDAVEREGLIPGHAYYIQTRGPDSGGTFKAFLKDGKNHATFYCLNRAKYPDLIKVEKPFNAAKLVFAGISATAHPLPTTK